MQNPDTRYLASVLAASEVPCVSIYLPTHRANGNLTDTDNRARFRGLADRAEEALVKAHPGPVARGIIDRLHHLRADNGFWEGVRDGAVVLASPDRFDAFTLPRTVPEFVTVGRSFHIKPLVRFVQSADPFHVLGVSRERVALFHGNRYELHPLEVPGVPLTLSDSLAVEVPTPAVGLRVAEPASTARPNARTGGQDSHGHQVGQGHATRKIDTHPEAERFFRDVDREVVHRVSEPSGLPVILVGIDDNLSAFRTVTKNRFLTAESVHGDWTKWTLPEIREKAWKVFEKHYLERLAKIREDFGTAAAHGKGTSDLAEAATAAAGGRVGLLLIDADRIIPGMIDMASGALHPAGAEAGDMLDDLAEIGLRTKAR